MQKKRWQYLIILTASIMTYLLGIGMARFLGYFVYVNKLILGAIWVLSITMSVYLLRKSRFSQLSPTNMERSPGGTNIFILFLSFAVLLTITALIYAIQGFSFSTYVLFGIVVIFSLLYIFLDQKLEAFTHLLIILWISYLVPLVSFVLQTGKFHPFVTLNTFYLIFVFLSFITLWELSEYQPPYFQKYPSSLIGFLGFRKGVLFHNFCLIFAYLSCSFLFFWGLPQNIYLPIFFTIPFSGFHIWKMLQRLDDREGELSWSKVIILHLVISFSLVYFPLYGYWTR